MNTDRIDHIFQFMEYDYISDAQHDLVVSFEKQWRERGNLSGRQVDILEDIFRRGNEA